MQNQMNFKMNNHLTNQILLIITSKSRTNKFKIKIWFKDSNYKDLLFLIKIKMKFSSNKTFQKVFRNTKIIEKVLLKSKKIHIEILILKEFLPWEMSELTEDSDLRPQEIFILLIKSRKRLSYKLLNRRPH